MNRSRDRNVDTRISYAGHVVRVPATAAIPRRTNAGRPDPARAHHTRLRHERTSTNAARGCAGIGLPRPLVLLSIPNFIPYRAALLTSPVGVPRDDRCQRPELLRFAFRTVRRLQVPIVARSPRFMRAFKRHDRDSRARMISAIVRSGRCVQTKRKRATIHRPTRSRKKTTAGINPPKALVRADLGIRTQESGKR